MRVWGAILALLLYVSVAQAQVVTGDILGTITDPSGAVVPNAKITITNLGTGTKHELTSGTGGEYILTSLPSGHYSINITAEGFRSSIISDVTLEAGGRLRQNVTLSLGQNIETVEVSGQTPALQTDTATLSSVVTEQQVIDLPLNGRNFVQLTQLAAGANEAVPNALASGSRPDDRRQTSSVSAFGQSDTLNYVMIDGIDNNEKVIGTIGVRPSVEAIAEFRVQTNVYPAEVGKSPGAVVNIITKSGVNEFHGSAFEFVRNDMFDARNFFSAPKANKKYRQNQFGGSFGGPIKKDKAFFFGDYEGMRIVQAQTFVSTVPTLYQQQHPGDFSDIGGPVLTSAQINQTALKYFELYPEPNLPGLVNNFTYSPNRTQRSDSFDVRFDYNFSDRDRFFARSSFNDVMTRTPDSFPAVNGISPGGSSVSFPGTSPQRASQFALSHTHMFANNSVLELRAGYTRINNASYPVNYGKDLGNQFGIVGSNINSFTMALPQMAISGYTGFGNSSWLPLIDLDNVFQYSGAMTMTRGPHTFKYGVALVRRQIYNMQNAYGPGYFSFTNNPTPFAMANFLQGNVYQVYRRVVLSPYYYRTWEPSFYVQDDWRATRWLTLNIGIRYDIFTPFTDASHSTQFSCFDPVQAKVLVAKTEGVSATCNVKTDYGSLAPRFGFAIMLDKDTVLRGGYGMAFFRDTTGPGTAFANPPNASWYAPNPLSVTLATPLPSPVGLFMGSTASGYQSDFKNSRANQINLNLQHSFAGNVVSVGYVGAYVRRLRLVPNINLAPPSTLPFATRRPYYSRLPNITDIAMVSSFGGTNYNAMLWTVERRLSRGLALSANYTWAHSTGDFQSYSSGGSYTSPIVSDWRKLEWGNTDLDIRHRVAVMLNYTLPFGQNLKGVPGAIGKGWHVNAIEVWQTGNYFSVVNASPRSNTGVSSDRPNMLRNPNISDQTLQKWFDTTAFQAQALGTIGSEGRNVLVGPRFRHFDLAFSKDFQIQERYTLQARFESFNLTNTPNFANPAATLGTATFGTINSTKPGSTPRDLQFALRFLF
jgi:hypothetical protein